MSNKDDVKEFLTSRRARVTPDRVALPGGPGRRVPGLRRTEVAMLAGVSVEYYAKLERGDLVGVSETVLVALADALLLDDAEREYLLDLAREANASPVRRRRRPSPKRVRTSMQWALDGFTAGPAFVRNGRMDVLAENQLFRGLYWGMYALPERPVNLARFTFLHREDAEHFHPNWSQAADITVAILRTEAGRNPHDRALQDLVGELSTRSEEFRTRWGAHDVRHHANGDKHFHHPVVGDLDLVYEAMEPMGDPGLDFLVYSAAPGSPSEDALRLLASWVATQEHERQDDPAGAAQPRGAESTRTPTTEGPA